MPGCPTRTPRARHRSPPCCPGLLLNVALYALLRFKMLLAANPGAIAPGPLMIALGLLSLIFAAFMLYRRRDIKRMFAYSSIEHMGIIVFAFGMAGPLGNFAGLLQMTMHSLTKSAIFFSVGHVAQVKGTQRIAEIGGLTESHPVLGWTLVAGVAAIVGLPPFGVFTSEFLLITSTFAREPVLAVLLVLGLLIAFGALLLRLTDVAFGAGARPDRTCARFLSCRSSRISAWCWSPGSGCRRRWSPGSSTSRRCSDEPSVRASAAGQPVDAIDPAARLAAPDTWQDASSHLPTAPDLLSLWGETGRVHMAVLATDPTEVAVLSLDCPDGRYPSVGARHAPAIRLERAIRDLFGLQPVGLPDDRPWLDHGRWDEEQRTTPISSCRWKATGLHQIPGRSGACRHHRARAFPLHLRRRDRRHGWRSAWATSTRAST